LKLQWNFANKKKTVSKISSVSQSFKIPKHPNKQTNKQKGNPQPSMLYNSFIIIIIKYKNHDKNAKQKHIKIYNQKTTKLNTSFLQF